MRATGQKKPAGGMKAGDTGAVSVMCVRCRGGRGSRTWKGRGCSAKERIRQQASSEGTIKTSATMYGASSRCLYAASTRASRARIAKPTPPETTGGPCSPIGSATTSWPCIASTTLTHPTLALTRSHSMHDARCAIHWRPYPSRHLLCHLQSLTLPCHCHAIAIAFDKCMYQTLSPLLSFTSTAAPAALFH
jgi:hypothetical protein